MKTNEIIIVEWEDSRQSDPKWQWIDDFEPLGICICTTIGYLIKITADALYISQSITDDGQMAGIITIPLCCIKTAHLAALFDSTGNKTIL